MVNPALFTKATEFLSLKDETLHLVHNGQVYPLDQIPDQPKCSALAAMNDHPYATEAFDYWSLTTEAEKLAKWVKCTRSKSDNYPDIDENGVVQKAEYVDCKERSSCPFNRKFCVGLEFDFGVITDLQTQILELITTGYQDNYICSLLDISQSTLRYHKNQIEEKMGVQGKVAMAVLAAQKQLPINIVTIKKQYI